MTLRIDLCLLQPDSEAKYIITQQCIIIAQIASLPDIMFQIQIILELMNRQECNVSSDGFHETLFIEKSPSKQQQSLKKRRKSKKAKEQEGRQDGKALRESRIDRKEGKARVKREENRTRNSKKEDQ